MYVALLQYIATVYSHIDVHIHYICNHALSVSTFVLYYTCINSSINFKTYITVLTGENSWCVILETFFLFLYKERSDNIRKKILTYTPKKQLCMYMYGTDIQNTSLTVIIANIGATNAHMAPFLVFSQQLFNTCRIKCKQLIEILTLVIHHVHTVYKQLQQ